ncbi:MarR family winged helix-turn-helix transcriptional regulator [Planomonospora venezuelensis]|uniref:DNA-binding MarR family transcriptional regulator n=1 Tax=Planomonospora venezuelensis TaxID=1999 RepID=A0A841CY58_PLAVE|nr:DNA-binding MarR family transcriptional regulator [Planomonospora venezuelensis]GIN04519.1 MarR family transcriptional regulator [Planomonospora venezuelensis]
MTLTASESRGTISSEELVVWRMLQRAQVRITRLLEADLLVEHDLALASYDVLTQLSESPDRRLRMNDLAERVLLSRSGLTRLIDRLQRDGLVEREACTSDARGLFAVLTDAGALRLAEATPTYLRGIRDRFLDVLDGDELRQCASMLTKLFPEAE